MNRLSVFAVGLVATGLTGQARETSTRPEQVDVGAHPKYTFQEPLLNGRGVRSLADLGGKPTIIEFWGTR